MGGATLNSANTITNLGTFDNTTSGDFALTDAATLNVTGALDDAVSDTGNITLKRRVRATTLRLVPTSRRPGRSR